MKVAIISRPENKSPKVLAQSLKHAFEEINVECKIFYGTGFLHRLTPLFGKGIHYRPNLNFKIRQRLKYFFQDRKIIKELKKYDAVILSECIPNAYWHNYYGIPKLKKLLNKPIGLYEVFFLDSSPRFLQEVSSENPDYKTFFDFEFAITTTSYVKTSTSGIKFEVGLNLKSSGIEPTKKEELIALVDFHWEGCDEEREIQKQVLEEVGIKTIELQGRYTVEEIRDIYKKSSLLFLQHFESFGLPIAECLGYGAKIVTPHTGWPMAFRQDAEPKEYGTGQLPECFISYNNKEELISLLRKIQANFDKDASPKEYFNSFIRYYQHYYEGSKDELIRFVKEFE